MKVTKPAQQAHLKQNERKWTKPLMDAGFTVIPNVILERQQALGLEPTDVNILLQLATYWWQAENLPHPSKNSIAQRIGVSEKTVQRHIAALEKAGFIKRKYRYSSTTRGQQPNIYDFAGLIKAATPFAQEEVERRQNDKLEKLQRATRKKPKLRLVKEEKG